MKGMRHMTNKKELYFCLLILGILLLCSGGYFLYQGGLWIWHDGEYLIPLLLIIMGGAFIMISINRLTMIRMIVKRPTTVHQIGIDAKDERQERINQVARSRAFTAMEIIYAAMILICIVLRDQWMISILLLIGGYGVGWIVYFIYLGKLAKKL